MIGEYPSCPKCGVPSATSVCPFCGSPKYGIMPIDPVPTNDTYTYGQLVAVRAEIAALRGDIARIMLALGLKYEGEE